MLAFKEACVNLVKESSRVWFFKLPFRVTNAFLQDNDLEPESGRFSPYLSHVEFNENYNDDDGNLMFANVGARVRIHWQLAAIDEFRSTTPAETKKKGLTKKEYDDKKKEKAELKKSLFKTGV